MFIDDYITTVPKVSIAVAIKDTSPPGPLFLFNHMEKFHYASLSDKRDIAAFMDRKTPGSVDIMKYSSVGNLHNWKIMVPLHDTNIKQRIHQYCIEETHNHC
jgi:hypothetical protein